jgi:hypothetical protein
MAIIHDTVTIESSHAMPSLGMLIGSRVSSDVFDAINGNGHASFFGDEFDHMNKNFFNQYVRPMDQLNVDLSRTVNALMNPDRFRILSSIEDFKSVPACMEMAILTFAPVRQGVLEGRMEGFGYDPSTLPPEDDYGRLIDNFTCEDVAAASDENGYYPISGSLFSDDPDLSDDDLLSIRVTREYILNRVLAETDRDPTAIELPRG